MNLIDLKRKVRELTTFINYQKAEIEEQRNTVKATNFDRVLVSGTPERQDISNVMVKIEAMERDVEKAQKEYDRLIPLINELEVVYKELNERDKLIYLEKYIKGYSLVKIGILHNITDRQVRNVLKKINEKFENQQKDAKI